MLTFLKSKGTKNIINIIDSGDGEIKFGNEIKKNKYLILEYAEKKELTRYISMIGNGFSEKKFHAQLLFLKILEAVKEIHKNGVVHRDLKEDNILLDIKFNPKICDFGYSTYINYTKKKIRGTVNYMAPEVLIDKNNCKDYSISEDYIHEYKGGPVDVFALGVILFYITTAKYSFENPCKSDKSYTYIIDHDYNKFWKMQNLNSDLSEDFKNLFVKMVEPNPKERVEINEIENYKWLKEFIVKSDKEKETIESSLCEEFLEREKKIKDSTQKTIETKGGNDVCNGNKDMEEEEAHFNNKDNKIRLFRKGKSLEFYIKIEGPLNKIKFMNDLYNKIEEEYEKNTEYDCKINSIDGKLKFKAFFNVIREEEEKNDEKRRNEVSKKNLESKENKENDEGNEENNLLLRNGCIINIELFKFDKGFLLRFLRKSGNLEDFYKNLKIIYSIAEELL